MSGLHPRVGPNGSRLRLCLSGLALAVGLGLGPASAQAGPPAENAAEGGSLDSVLRALNLKAETTHAPDFVRQSRRPEKDLHFLPVGTPHPERSDKVMTPAEIAAMTSSLDATRMADQKRAGLKPVPVPEKPKKSNPATSPR